jgi:hypothetical protein
MKLEEITYLLNSFNEALKINAAFLDMYKIEVNLLPSGFVGDITTSYAYRVELFMTIGSNQLLKEGLKEYRKNIGSYALDTYELKDFFMTTDRVVNSFDKTEWFLNWKKSIEREYKLKKIGISF